MSSIVSLLLLAFAVSLDGFGVGAMYGLRKIRIPFLSLVIISLCSALVILLSMKLGVWLLRFIPAVMAKDIGAMILIGIGIWTVYQVSMQKDEPESEASDRRKEKRADSSVQDSELQDPETTKPLFTFEWKRMGIVIQILRTPSAADMDRSGIISPAEAGLLGIALSFDAFGAGIGAALIGYPPLMTAAIIAGTSGLFLASGLRVGYRFSGLDWIRRVSALPGCILILMGIMKML
ncbi:sporulation membrane protein YtaF [Gorillibacterium timonense]|uniref:sporulation membrane protein YtaF n=1 Tax=Gorillibacterium timonense TaxID=1689269 RepID=UPI00071DC6DC|nr:sporulation membrane protein YtaF [Gorillibacterium timonense]